MASVIPGLLGNPYTTEMMGLSADPEMTKMEAWLFSCAAGSG